MTRDVSLIERLEMGKGYDNSLDVLVEIALFKPGKIYASIRANAAGTKVIYTQHTGQEVTCWAEDWTANRPATIAALRARSAS